MCDLFALCATRNYAAATSLPLFATRGRNNVHGWGIGFFRQNHPVIEKSAEKVFRDGQPHASFQRLARVVASPLILAHIRYKSSGKVDECHAHPFTLDIWKRPWIFAHNGKAPAIEAYQSRHTPILEATSDSARTFEFLRDYFTDATPRRQHTTFLQILQEALVALIQQYPGQYNFLLTNGRIIWAFTNHRQFLLLKGSRKLEDALLLTTIEEGLSPEN
ncbi:MAG: class II glutamine amidotransferase [Deltaproteobacteria bacterium]|nr:class II glutamine amidotransferase [Deltaproteobacteria bacterium]